MADNVFSELSALTRDLGKVAENAGPNIRKAIEVTSLKVKRDWQGPLKGSAYFPALPYAISFDVTSDGRTVESEIGFDKDRNQGALGNISEFGTPTISGRGYGLTALEANQADFERGLSIALEQAEKEAGL